MHDVAFEKVTKKFGKVVAVNNISFQVNIRDTPIR